MSEYNASNIQVLEGLEAVRKRPGMYIGTTGIKGLHHLVWEIVDNSIDEAMAGFASVVNITITTDGSVIVEDDGRGIPVAIHPKTGKSTVETVLTVLHAGGKFDSDTYKVSGGLHGVGASVVNALSDSLEVWVERDGNLNYQHFKNGGKAVEPMKIVGTTDRQGTKIKFHPDYSVMDENEFDFEAICDRTRQTAYLNKGLRLIVKDERIDKIEDYHFEGGIVEYVSELNHSKEVINEEIIYAEGHFKGTDGDVITEVAFQYNTGFQANIVSYANNIATIEGGTHEQGFMDALIRIFNQYAGENKLFKDEKEKLSRDDVKEGLTAIISIKHMDPVFEGQTKGKLGNKDARMATNKVLSEMLERFLVENPLISKTMIEKSLLAQRARFAAQNAREVTRRKSVFDIGSLPGKLADCSSKNAEISEVYIVEGDSAGGSAKLGRDRETQAILPLRGKVINTEKARIDKVFANNEIGALIIALGTSVGEDFNINKLRYHKIIIMTDADVDGAHIRTLLLTFFYRYLRPLIEYGFIYIAQPPLYKVSTGKKIIYAYSDAEKDNYLKTLSEDTKFTIQRYKGLGEMDPDQLWDTTMDPEERKMLQVQINDAAAADLTFSILMGDDVEPRRNFINTNAKYAEIDV
ncbi:DNA topoisomerase (ATP-hydrolyzing) subunit B [Candidatus Mycoplasma mahonii]|uniref:DNA topoisomerase (ATP-hydrolyzing) subunit B n=1 Tax=Candidatus Mycoplasma mahonii TaxID=3004105 RepID=UPI0026EAA2EF|nr:DNA topoisomerase (ATP-hydrolyzing) subunit B [Candidatus Mycoplasma mahonii]WKX02434.1 DNA topoisomerase (ATP-hydrolyzing) subunit B [Candidatus Mycoplasma mahonii]